MLYVRHISISIHHIQKLQQCHNIAHHNYGGGFSLNYGSGLLLMVVHSINFCCPCSKMEHIKGMARVAYYLSIVSSTFECRDQPTMFIVSPIMLCCTAQIVHILCKYCWSILTYYTQFCSLFMPQLMMFPYQFNTVWWKEWKKAAYTDMTVSENAL